MDDDMIYYAKSPNSQGYQQTVKEHLQAVAELAQKFGTPMGLATAAKLAGQTHDFGKYSQAFQEVLRGIRTGGWTTPWAARAIWRPFTGAALAPAR